MATTTISYASWAALTITLASLATDANKLIGRASSAISNSTNKYMDARLAGKITAGTSPTASKTIEVWVYGEINGTPDYVDGITGTDAAKTITSAGIKNAALKLAAVLPTDATSDQAYYFTLGSIAALFGGVMPEKWGIFVAHDTGVALNATGTNHEINYQGVKYDTV